MLSWLQELCKEEETLLRVKAVLHDQLNRLKEPENILVQVDNETSINQTELQLSTRNHAQEEEEEE
uniref:snRNA-activating protein complex subunit 5-like isoform X2 n=1 Tax=Phascolarctos cinereus TaxID=38626 RepID=A0A6P5LH92_PHACI|nr:snRNA-activating protein complex subunit 5-like isoform X2 [Phascolarctos cinereus]